MAVGISNMWQVTHDTHHMIYDLWYMISTIKFFFGGMSFFVTVLLSYHVKRFSVSCMRDFWTITLHSTLFKRYREVTNKQTNQHTEIATFRLNRPRNWFNAMKKKKLGLLQALAKPLLHRLWNVSHWSHRSVSFPTTYVRIRRVSGRRHCVRATFQGRQVTPGKLATLARERLQSRQITSRK